MILKIMESEIELSVIIVIYKGEKFLKNCLASVFDKIKNIRFEIILVNNGEKDIILEDFPTIKIIKTRTNLGFGRGHNLGIKSAKENMLWILNTDTEVLAGDVENVLREIREKRGIGVIGVRLMSENNRVQPWSAGVEPTIWGLIRNNLGFPASRAIWQSAKKREVDWVSGTSLFIRKDIFDKLGGFDEKFFMYFEDIDLCKRAREAGYKVVYYPEFAVRHFGGKSFENSELQKKYYYQSQDYYFEKHFGKFQSGLVKLLRKLFIFN
jgi:hypothetical protein